MLALLTALSSDAGQKSDHWKKVPRQTMSMDELSLTEILASSPNFPRSDNPSEQCCLFGLTIFVSSGNTMQHKIFYIQQCALWYKI